MLLIFIVIQIIFENWLTSKVPSILNELAVSNKFNIKSEANINPTELSSPTTTRGKYLALFLNSIVIVVLQTIEDSDL